MGEENALLAAKLRALEKVGSELNRDSSPYPLEFQPHCKQLEWLRLHLGGWQFGEQELIPAILDVIGCDDWCIEYGAGDGEELPLTLDKVYCEHSGQCKLIEIDPVKRAKLESRYGHSDEIRQSLPWARYSKSEPSVVVIDIDGRDSVVLREMLDSGCRPALIVCEHMDRHYSIPTTQPNPIPEWLLGTRTEHGHAIQDTAETLHWMAGKYGYERIGLNRCNSFFVRRDLFPRLFR